MTKSEYKQLAAQISRGATIYYGGRSASTLGDLDFIARAEGLEGVRGAGGEELDIELSEAKELAKTQAAEVKRLSAELKTLSAELVDAQKALKPFRDRNEQLSRIVQDLTPRTKEALEGIPEKRLAEFASVWGVQAGPDTIADLLARVGK